MAACNRYSGEDDFRYPALKCRLESFKRFKYTTRGRGIEVEGIFIYKLALPQRNSKVYVGFIDSMEEYRLLNLRPPEKDLLKIWCHIPSNLATRERLLSKPNLRLRGKVSVEGNNLESKTLIVEDLEFLPVEYTAVGAPAFIDLDDMFSCIYSRGPELYEHGPLLLLASLVGSERKSRYFPEENAGCGINMGSSAEDSPRKVSSGRITSSMRKQLLDFIRRVNIGSLDSISDKFRWNRFLSIEDPLILSRTIQTKNEIDWNLVSDIDGINNLKRSRFITSDINLVFDPNIFPRKMNRDDLKNLRQTILFAKSTSGMSYSAEADAWIENGIDKVVRDLAKRVDYAPFLFRYRLEPLCDAFLRANHLEDLLLGGSIGIKRKDVKDFFSIAEDAACDFAEYSRPYVDERVFSSILDSMNDKRLQNLYRELLVKGGMTENDMKLFLEKHAVAEKKADSLVSSLLHSEPVLVVKQGSLYRPVG
ncbi:MAG: hypothetical protein JW778_07045 [Candidatus Altiarchaeota archaeon]|nr:hypothetical protein [Candidatus Altiarchaeota archaeon]